MNGNFFLKKKTNFQIKFRANPTILRSNIHTTIKHNIQEIKSKIQLYIINSAQKEDAKSVANNTQSCTIKK